MFRFISCFILIRAIRSIRGQLQLVQNDVLVNSHKLEGKKTTSKILERGSKVIKAVVEDKETVVEATVVFPDLYPSPKLLLVQLL